MDSVTTIEEEIFYPAYLDAVRTRDDKELYFEALEEHHVVDLVMPEIKARKRMPMNSARRQKC